MRKSDVTVVTVIVRTRDGRDVSVTTRATRVPYLTGLLRKAVAVDVVDSGQPIEPLDHRPWGAVVTSYGTVRFALDRPGQVAALAGMLRKAHTRVRA